jgi:hypothetical protein
MSWRCGVTEMKGDPTGSCPVLACSLQWSAAHVEWTKRMHITSRVLRSRQMFDASKKFRRRWWMVGRIRGRLAARREQWCETNHKDHDHGYVVMKVFSGCRILVGQRQRMVASRAESTDLGKL